MLLMMNTYLLKYQLLGGTWADGKAAVDLVKESGGRTLHIAPIIGGWVVECTSVVADALGLIPWE